MITFKYKRQPRGSWDCGHTCIAMFSGKTRKEIREKFPTDHGLNTKMLVKILRSFGYAVPNRLVRYSKKNQPIFAIAKQPIKGTRNWHWVLIWNGKKYDPAGKNHIDYDNKLTSFLPIRNIKH
jgi:hypothetical protein